MGLWCESGAELDLGAAEAHLVPPTWVRKVLNDALTEASCYREALGVPRLRATIAARAKALGVPKLGPEQVAVSPRATPALVALILSQTRPSGKVLAQPGLGHTPTVRQGKRRHTGSLAGSLRCRRHHLVCRPGRGRRQRRCADLELAPQSPLIDDLTSRRGIGSKLKDTVGVLDPFLEGLGRLLPHRQRRHQVRPARPLRGVPAQALVDQGTGSQTTRRAGGSVDNCLVPRPGALQTLGNHPLPEVCAPMTRRSSVSPVRENCTYGVKGGRGNRAATRLLHP